MYIGFEQVAATDAVQGFGALTVPANTSRVEIQADTQVVRYMMDGTVPTQAVGMLFRLTDPPKDFAIEDLQNIQWVRGAGADGNLNFHYVAGRDDL